MSISKSFTSYTKEHYGEFVYPDYYEWNVVNEWVSCCPP